MFQQRRSRFSKTNRFQNFQKRGNGGFRGRHRPKTIDPRFFVQKAASVVEEQYQAQNSFDSFPIHSSLKNNIAIRGYKQPTPIQDQAIPHLLSGRDVVGIASTGTGKTAAFLIPLINKVLIDRSQRILIVAPTRELAVQIRDEFELFAQGMNIHCVLCIGGVGIRPQIQRLMKRPSFVVGTPGRLKDLEQQRKLSFFHFNSIVLDEVDRMLDMGFIHDVSYIVSHLPKPRQSLFFSATLPSAVQSVMRGFLDNPVTVSVKASQPSANVDQDVVKLQGRAKVDVLHDLLRQEGFNKVLVFGRTKWGMEKLSQTLSQRGVRVAAIHGNKNQNQRQKAIELFKANQVQALLATDIASRGLDIDNVTHVINYDQPESLEDYIHRIGRTGRANKKGVALTFVD